MYEIFIDCPHCGYPNAQEGVDPDMLSYFRSLPSRPVCMNKPCNEPLTVAEAYIGKRQGRDVIRLDDVKV